MSQRARIPTSLPMLPGYTFYDARVSNFDKPQTLKKYTNGFQAVDTVPEFVRPCSLRGTSPAGSSASPFGSSYENELAHHLEKSSSSWKTTTPVNDYRATSESPSVPNLQGKVSPSCILYSLLNERDERNLMVFFLFLIILHVDHGASFKSESILSMYFFS